MASAVGLRADYSAAELRRLAAVTKNASKSRRLLSLAGVLDGMNRTEAARIGGMDRQTLRDWVPSVQRAWPRGSSGQLVQGSRAAPLERAAGRGSRTRLNRAGPGHPRCGALASDRPAARHSRAVRDRLPRSS